MGFGLIVEFSECLFRITTNSYRAIINLYTYILKITTAHSKSSQSPMFSLVTLKSKSHYDRRPVGQSVLVSKPIWVSWPAINYCLTFTVLSMSGAPSDERLDLSSVLVA
jgi:hypothetical protein